MQKQRYSLIELERDLGISIEELIGYGADGALTIHVIADNWPGKEAGDEKTTAIADGPVELLPSDLLKALNAESTEVRQVKTAGRDVVVLDSPQTVSRGVHFVTAPERERVRDELRPASQSTTGASVDTSQPYLDSEHEYYSYTLEAAIEAWMALYAEGGFKKRSLGHIDQIETWLSNRYPDLKDFARKRIAGVVNPNKGGGNPLIKK